MQQASDRVIINPLSCPVKHNWVIMKEAINNYIGSLNWGYRVALRDKNVNYVNAYAEFVEPHKIKVPVQLISPRVNLKPTFHRNGSPLM